MYGLDISHLANLLKDTQRDPNDSGSDDDQVCEEERPNPRTRIAD